MRTIEITVDAQGQSRVETKGFAGPACREASKPFEQALGLWAAEALTAEFHQSQRADQHLNQSG